MQNNYKTHTVIPCTGTHALKPKYLEIDAALNFRICFDFVSGSKVPI